MTTGHVPTKDLLPIAIAISRYVAILRNSEETNTTNTRNTTMLTTTHHYNGCEFESSVERTDDDIIETWKIIFPEGNVKFLIRRNWDFRDVQTFIDEWYNTQDGTDGTDSDDGPDSDGGTDGGCRHWKTIATEWEKSARRRKKEWNVPVNYLVRLFNGVCKLSGLPISPGLHSKDYVGRTVSLDRIVSSIGEYVAGNIQLVHKRVNVAKQNLPDELFVELCRAVVNHHDKTNEPRNMTGSELANELAKHPMI